MQLRKMLLRVLLWSLGIAALSGALAILVAAEEVIWRVVGTAIATAVAAGVMMAVTLLLDRDKSRWSGVLGMWLVAVEFLGSLFLIWEIGDILGRRWDIDGRVAITMFAAGVTGIAGMLFLRLIHRAELSIAARSGAWLCLVTLIWLVTAAWATDFWNSDELFASGWVFAGYGLLACACLVSMGVHGRWWRWIGVAAAGAGCAIAIYAIWYHLQEGSWVFTVITSIACVVALANVVMLMVPKPGQQWVKWGTIACCALAAAFVDADAVLNPQDGSELLLRVAGAFGLMSACGVLALLVLWRLNQGVGLKPVLSEIRELTLICPGCGRKQTVGMGQSNCEVCRLKFSIQVEEPRCPNCGYLLYMLKSAKCPECGAEVAAGNAGDGQQAMQVNGYAGGGGHP